MRLQPAVVVALGEESAGIAAHFVEAMRSLNLPNGEQYPASLYRIIEVLPAGASAVNRVDSCISVNTESGDSLPALDLGKLGAVLRDCSDAIHDRMALADLDRVLEGEQVPSSTHFHIIAASCDGFGDQLFERVIRCMAEEFSSQPRSRISGLILLPGLFDGVEHGSPEERRARAFAFLEKASALTEIGGDPLEDDCRLVETLWLVGSVDQAGRALRGLSGVAQPLGEALAAMVSQSFFDYRFDGSEPHKGFRGFGLSKLAFARDEMAAALAANVTSKLLANRVLWRGQLDHEEVILNVGQFVVDDLELAIIETEIRHDRHGMNLVTEFSLARETLEEIDGETFVRNVERARTDYARSVFPAVKRRLITRAPVVGQEKVKLVRQKLVGMVDEEEAGPVYAKAFLSELVDSRGDADSDSEVGTEESYNVEAVIAEKRASYLQAIGGDELRQSLAACEVELHKARLGLGSTPSPRRTMRRKPGPTRRISSETASSPVGTMAPAGSTKDDSGQSATLSDMNGRQRQAKEKPVSGLSDELEATYAELKAQMRPFEEAQQSGEAWQHARDFAAQRREQAIEESKRVILTNSKDQQQTEERMSDVANLGKVYLRAFGLLGFPVVACLLTGLSVIAIKWGYLGLWGGVSWVLLGMLAYAFGAGWVFYRNVYLEMRFEQAERSHLVGASATLRRELKDAVAEHFNTLIVMEVMDLALEQLRHIQERSSEMLVALDQFLVVCQEAQERLAAQRLETADSITTSHLVSDQDREYFLSLVLDSSHTEAARVSSEIPPSGFALEGSEGEAFIELVQRRFTSVIAEGLEDVSIESLICERYLALTDDSPPQARVRAFLNRLEPLVALQDPVLKEPRFRPAIYIGLEDCERSSLTEMLGTVSGAMNANLYSHGVPTMIIGMEVLPRFRLEDLAWYDEYRAAYEKQASGGANGTAT